MKKIMGDGMAGVNVMEKDKGEEERYETARGTGPKEEEKRRDGVRMK